MSVVSIALYVLLPDLPWAAAGGPVWAWIGVVPLATGAIGWCPPYAIFGISTCAVKKPQE